MQTSFLRGFESGRGEFSALSFSIEVDLLNVRRAKAKTAGRAFALTRLDPDVDALLAEDVVATRDDDRLEADPTGSALQEFLWECGGGGRRTGKRLQGQFRQKAFVRDDPRSPSHVWTSRSGGGSIERRTSRFAAYS